MTPEPQVSETFLKTGFNEHNMKIHMKTLTLSDAGLPMVWFTGIA